MSTQGIVQAERTISRVQNSDVCSRGPGR